MSRESKILKPGIWGVEKTIYHYESFGWELLSLNGNRIALSRETQSPVYKNMVANEAKYAQLVKEYKEMTPPTEPVAPAPFRFGKCCLLLLLLVVPGLVYMGRKSKQKRRHNQAVAAYKKQLEAFGHRKQAILVEIDKLLRESRATFFGK